MTTARKLYAPIDVHADSSSAWPAEIPPLTDRAAINALSRLYRFGCGTAFHGNVYITTGNRRAVRFAWETITFKGRPMTMRCVHLNPSQGWRDFVHDLSHWLDQIVNGESKHGKFHARFEAKLVREVIKRGWLEPEPPAPEAPEAKPDPYLLKLRRLDDRLLNWQRKFKRAENALKKLVKERKRALAAQARFGAKTSP